MMTVHYATDSVRHRRKSGRRNARYGPVVHDNTIVDLCGAEPEEAPLMPVRLIVRKVYEHQCPRGKWPLAAAPRRRLCVCRRCDQRIKEAIAPPSLAATPQE